MDNLHVRHAEGGSEDTKDTAVNQTVGGTESMRQSTSAAKSDPQPTGTTDARQADKTGSDNERETLDAIKKGERFALIIAGIVAFGTIGQWITTAYNNASTSAQADKLISAANKNAAAAEKFRIAAEGINEGVGNAVIKLQAQADKMDTARQSSEVNSKKALDATIDSFHRDQRAWVSVEPATGVPNDSTFKIAIPINNAGRTPATSVMVYFDGKAVKQNEKFSYTFTGSPVPFGYLAPGKPSSAFTYNGDQSKIRVPLKQPTDYYLVFGAITYEDVFRGKHWLTYCFFNFEGQSYSYCPEHNQIGDGPLPESELK